MDLKLNAGTPTNAWWRAKVDVCLMIYSDDDPIRDKLRNQWMDLSGRLTSYLTEFLTLVDYPKKLFSCCKDPDIVSFDGEPRSITFAGIVLSIESRRILDAKLTTPWKGSSTVTRATSRGSRAVLPISKKEDRERLHQHSHGGIGAAGFAILERAIHDICPPISALMTVSAQLVDDKYRCHPALVSFFRSCAKYIFPAIHLMPKSIWNAMDSFISTRTLSTTTKEAIALHSPMLTGLLAYLGYISNPESVNMVYIRYLL